MPFPVTRRSYGFEPQEYDYQNSGGLPGLLRDAMQRQGLQQEGGAGTTASSAPNPYADNYGSPQGLLGRLLALQTKQGSPIGVEQGSTASSGAPMLTPVQFRIPMPGPLPFPPTGPQSVPQIPMPHLPEPWPTIGKILQMLPILTRNSIFGRSKEQDDACPGCQNEQDGSTEGARKAPGGPRAPKLPVPPPPPSSESYRVPVSSGGGGRRGNRNSRTSDHDPCYERESEELSNCYRRWGMQEYAHTDFYPACIKRANIRRDLCIRNNGNFDHGGPGEWSPYQGRDDEEVWINVGR